MSTAASMTPGSKAAKAKKAAQLRERQVRRAAILLKQASEPTRLLVLLLLLEGEMHVGALCDELNLGQPAVSHHLALLRVSGLIESRREGKHNFYGLTETGEELAQVVRAVMP